MTSKMQVAELHEMVDLPKPNDRFDNFENETRNRETCLKAGFTISSVVYKFAGVDHRLTTH